MEVEGEGGCGGLEEGLLLGVSWIQHPSMEVIRMAAWNPVGLVLARRSW